jgi:hypothetical protein
MGGVFSGPVGTPYLWRHPWTTSEAARLVTFANPAGNLSINDFEITGYVTQLWLALLLMAPLTTILSGSDNSTSIYWIRKGNTSTSKPAGALLPLHSWLFQQHRVTAPVTFLAGAGILPTHNSAPCLTVFSPGHILDNAPPDIAAAARAIYGLCQDEVAAGVDSSRASTDQTNWLQWCAFCLNLRLDSSLDGVQDPILLLQMFAH